jgi:hypothetical protein
MCATRGRRHARCPSVERAIISGTDATSQHTEVEQHALLRRRGWPRRARRSTSNCAAPQRAGLLSSAWRVSGIAAWYAQCRGRPRRSRWRYRPRADGECASCAAASSLPPTGRALNAEVDVLRGRRRGERVCCGDRSVVRLGPYGGSSGIQHRGPVATFRTAAGYAEPA